MMDLVQVPVNMPVRGNYIIGLVESKVGQRQVCKVKKSIRDPDAAYEQFEGEESARNKAISKVDEISNDPIGRSMQGHGSGSWCRSS